MIRMVARLAAVSLACLLTGCSYIAVMSAPEKRATTQRSDEARKADVVFWKTLHEGRYQDIDRLIEIHTAAYLKDPSDAVTAARTGWLHIWRLSESARMGDSVPATITNHAVLARKFFEEASRLDPGEARYTGFVGAARLAEGTIHHDEGLVRSGYYKLLEGVRAWPEFNLFTAGYVMARRAADTPQFAEALEMQWRNIDICIGQRIDRSNPDFGPFMKLETREGPKRACWNSVIAPHNFEGVFMNMGDMLMKAGDPQTARKIYANARLSSTYGTWPFREALERRMADANAQASAPAGAAAAKASPMMLGSAYACVGCHQVR